MSAPILPRGSSPARLPSQCSPVCAHDLQTLHAPHRHVGAARAAQLLALVTLPADLPQAPQGRATRAEVAQALNMVLFGGILERVPTGRAYTDDVAAAGAKVTFDHGALRTVKWRDNGALPEGEAAFTRILRPLGYVLNGTYPLDRIGMTGRSYAHADAPEDIAQFFLSEFHPERFSDAFRAAVSRVTGTSADPLTPRAQTLLWQLERDGALDLADGASWSACWCHASSASTPRRAWPTMKPC